MIGFLIMRFSDDPIAAVVPITGQLRGGRADHGFDRDPDVHPQRDRPIA